MYRRKIHGFNVPNPSNCIADITLICNKITTTTTTAAAAATTTATTTPTQNNDNNDNNNYSKGRSGRIAHLTFRRTKKILNTNESVRN